MRFRTKHIIVVCGGLTFFFFVYLFTSNDGDSTASLPNNNKGGDDLDHHVNKKLQHQKGSLNEDSRHLRREKSQNSSYQAQWPAGGITRINLPQISRRETVVYGEALPYCGMKSPCLSNQMPIYVYSGRNKDEEPKICLDGRFVVAKNLNKSGRGLNLAVVNATSRETLRVGHFDTYADDSNALEIFLEEVINDEIVVAVSFDEASSKLSAMAKQMLFELGSGLIQNLKFRASWFFIGQKGISGFTPFEELNYATGNDWAKAVDKRLCIPLKLDGMRVRPDPIALQRNEAKRTFCQKYDGYEDFCDEQHIDDPIKPAPLFNKALINNPIFAVPILVVAGLSHNSLRLCLETVIKQPGINPSYVLVTYDENYPESHALAKLFQFKSKNMSASASYNVQFFKSLDFLWKEYPEAQSAIIIEEELMLTVDFLYFMSQMWPVLEKDHTLLAISAWNDNGFKGMSTIDNIAYRISGFPGMGFMMRRDTYEQYLQLNFETCCMKRAFEGWSLPAGLEAQMIVPDVSRVTRRHVDGFGIVDREMEDLFHRERSFSTDPQVQIINVSSLYAENYDQYLYNLIQSAEPLPITPELKDCTLQNSNAEFELNFTSHKAAAAHAYVIQFDQSLLSDYSTLRDLCRCLGLYSSTHTTSRGLYKGLLRFSFQQKQIFLVGSQSPFHSAIKSHERSVR